MWRIRPEIRTRIPTQPGRAKFLADVLEDREVWDALKESGVDEAYALAMRKGGLAR